MHVISSNGETTHLWLNSNHEKSGNKPQISLGNASTESQISLGNASTESVVAEVATLTKDTKFSYHNIVKVVRGNFIGFYDIVIETMILTE